MKTRRSQCEIYYLLWRCLGGIDTDGSCEAVSSIGIQKQEHKMDRVLNPSQMGPRTYQIFFRDIVRDKTCCGSAR